MIINPFDKNIAHINDPEDFKLPYQYSGRTDVEVMFRRYQNLHKNSYGCIIRLGIISAK